MFVVGNRFYSLYTQCQQRDDRAFCSLILKCHTNSAAVENNFMRCCISLTHIWYTLQSTYTSANNKWFAIRLQQPNTQL